MYRQVVAAATCGLVFWLAVCACLGVCLATAWPARAAGLATGPADYRSANFFLHTDLTENEAAELLDRLETMLGLISTYWGRPPSGIIECYVVRDLAAWPPGSLTEEGRRKIEAGAGVTLTQKLTSGKRFLAKAIVFAVADRGTPQHEAVHAYCGQAFGTTGPVWYSEGMAEMGQYWRKDDPSVQCHPGVLEYLQKSAPQSLNEIVNGQNLSGDSWQNYAWRWALCHLLANNTNYASRFRPLGLALLTEQNATFESVYGDMAEQISFEYRFFLTHVVQGYRVDLCSWDWKKKFKPLKGRGTATAKILAARGWQPSGATLTAGTRYAYAAPGSWQTNQEAKSGRTADGTVIPDKAIPDKAVPGKKGGGPVSDNTISDKTVADDTAGGGTGRLVGALFKDFKLGEPFDLGASGTLTAPADGQLFLRCQDDWAALADNKGQLTVKLKVAAE